MLGRMRFHWLVVALCLAACHTRAEVPIQNGLIWNLDAAEQASLRRASKLPELPNGRSLDRWLDGSPSRRMAVQHSAAARPVFRTDGSEAWVRFDGKDDALSSSVMHPGARELTVFLLAAPRANSGGFSGPFASARAGRNDYTDGINLDQGPEPTPQLSVISIESSGASGFRNLLEPGRNLSAGLTFEQFHVFTLRSHISTNAGNEVFIDGLRIGSRPRSESVIGLDELVVGGRYYSNDPSEAPEVQGSFHGDIATVLVYDRALSDDERGQVEQALLKRAPNLNALARGGQGHSLQTVKDAPLVQMLAPGFVVDELPLKLRNLNGVRYRHDGKVVGLAYDGRIHLLSDTDGDGLEDTSKVFWDKLTLRGPIGMALLPKSDPRGDGVIVASKGKVSLILDRDRDGVADEEIIVARGWNEIAPSVDAIGVAIDPRDGSIYFGLGTANYADGYLIDPATGKAGYRTNIQNGTIQKVSADFLKRETVCTGTRFTCALAFNREGDLFASEQEGATWLPNGNPLDELLHIRPGLHFGFPPRHPTHLPEVIDEPATFEYSPQHQSTVGMVFNEGVNGGPAFGPAHWWGDALLCGESRGKLYRTKLVKTSVGYVAQNQLIACLGMLTVDACVSPQGALLVACHSGPPDWGTGPAGEGKLFRIRLAKTEVPQPVASWASAPDELRVAFDRPLKDAEWAGAASKTRVEAGRYLAAGDRFEVMRPGYQVVRDQMGAPRRWVEVQGVSLSADRRTIVVRIPRQTQRETYGLTLPVPTAWAVASPIPQKPEMDFAITLNGVRAQLGRGAVVLQSVILPHPSWAVSKALTQGSSDHEGFFRAVAAAASGDSLRFQSELDVRNLFVPAVQPGATLDWDLTKDTFATRTMKVVRVDGSSVVAVAPTPREDRAGAADLELAASASDAAKAGELALALDERVRPLPLNRVISPWAATTTKTGSVVSTAERTDVHGNWLNGRRVFYGTAGCATCHVIRGEGMAFGPELSNLVHRDRESVLKDILHPSATINPDHTGTRVRFRDGTEVQGWVRKLTETQIELRLPANTELIKPRAEVVSMEPMTASLMPENLVAGLSPAAMEDLLTFLLTTPLEPAPITRIDPGLPLARSRAEFEEFLPAAQDAPPARKPLRVLLCADDKDHGLDEHDYPVWQKRWSRLLGLADGVRVSQAQGFPSPAQLADADVTVFFSRNSGWSKAAAQHLDEYQKRGGGLVYLHWGMEGGKEATALAERIGLATDGSGFSKYRHGPLELQFLNTNHPVTRGFTTLKMMDESYWRFHGEPTRLKELAVSEEDGAPRTQIWAFEKGDARVFGSIPGHYTWTFDDPLYRVIVLRGIAWAARETDVDRLLELTTVGARIRP